jgi:exodeoxyribonuclease-3
MQILDSREYDVICVQEIKADDASFPHGLFETSGYNVMVFGQKSYNGVAVFSKYSIEDASRGMPHYPDANARLLECLIDGRIRLLNVYMPNGESIDSPKFPYKMEWMENFTHHIREYAKSDEPIVIAGDFNVAIEDRDIWNPRGYEGSSISAPPARKIMREWLDAGWTDEWRRFHPEETGYTWYGYRGRDTVGNKQGLRLDYFLTNAAAARMTQGCHIDMGPRLAQKATDHAGLVLQME